MDYITGMSALWRSLQYLAEQRRTAAEELLHAGELLCSFALQSNIWQPTAGQSLHGGTVGDGCTVQRSHT